MVPRPDPASRPSPEWWTDPLVRLVLPFTALSLSGYASLAVADAVEAWAGPWGWLISAVLTLGMVVGGWLITRGSRHAVWPLGLVLVLLAAVRLQMPWVDGIPEKTNVSVRWTVIPMQTLGLFVLGWRVRRVVGAAERS